ncbi:MAG: hypothetical protein IPP16_13010 [Acidimicrobiaceae bacterium]|nr:hypothetical protein [Acidimicrobiaceae bacterium]
MIRGESGPLVAKAKPATSFGLFDSVASTIACRMARSPDESTRASSLLPRDWRSFVVMFMGGKTPDASGSYTRSLVVGLGFQWSGEDGPGLPSGDGNLDCLEPEASDVGETLHFPG